MQSLTKTLGVELLHLFERLQDKSETELYLQLAVSSSPIIRRSAARDLFEWADAPRKRRPSNRESVG